MIAWALSAFRGRIGAAASTEGGDAVLRGRAFGAPLGGADRLERRRPRAVFATLSPIGARPHLAHMGPQLERFIAYLVAAAALATAYPARKGTILLCIVAGAARLEIAQHFEASRHARALDAVVKIMGGVSGLAVSSSANGSGRSALPLRSPAARTTIPARPRAAACWRQGSSRRTEKRKPLSGKSGAKTMRWLTVAAPAGRAWSTG